jgi:hypothetical protein
MSGDDYPSDDDKSFVSAKSSHNVNKDYRFSPEEEAVCRKHYLLTLCLVLTIEVTTRRVEQTEDRSKLTVRSWVF